MVAGKGNATTPRRAGRAHPTGASHNALGHPPGLPAERLPQACCPPSEEPGPHDMAAMDEESKPVGSPVIGEDDLWLKVQVRHSDDFGPRGGCLLLCLGSGESPVIGRGLPRTEKVVPAGVLVHRHRLGQLLSRVLPMGLTIAVHVLLTSVECASRGTRTSALGLPQPVTRSHPATAG